MQLAEVEIGQAFDCEDRALVGLERAEQQALPGQIDVLLDEIGGCRWTTIVMDKGDHLPVSERYCDAAVNRVRRPEDRTGEDARALADPSCVAEDVILKTEPCLLVESG